MNVTCTNEGLHICILRVADRLFCLPLPQKSGEETHTLKLSLVSHGDAAQLCIGDWPPVGAPGSPFTESKAN